MLKSLFSQHCLVPLILPDYPCMCALRCRCRAGASPLGWVLPSYPSAADATMAGAVATGSHSSSTAYGLLSNQVVGLTVALANGSVVQLSEDSDPHLFDAMRVSVGRLGVITSVTSRCGACSLRCFQLLVRCEQTH